MWRGIFNYSNPGGYTKMNSKKKEFKVGQSIKIKRKKFPESELAGTILNVLANGNYFVAIKKCIFRLEIEEKEIVK